MNAYQGSRANQVMAGDRQVHSQVGMHLLGDLGDRAGLTSVYSATVPWTGKRAPGHDRGRLLATVAVMLAGGQCVADMAAHATRPICPVRWPRRRRSGAVRDVDAAVLEGLRRARAQAQAKVWASLEAPEEVVLDVNAALVEVHSEHKEWLGAATASI